MSTNLYCEAGRNWIRDMCGGKKIGSEKGLT